MADLTPAEPPRRSQLVERLRGRLSEVVPTFRMIAEGVLGADSSIDFVGVEPTGRVVLELIGRAIAQRAWVEPRIRDWVQLAPNLGVRPGAGARVVLLCPSFCHAAEVAASALGDQAVSLVRYRCLHDRGKLEVLVEPIAAGAARGSSAPRPESAGTPAFRTGLRDEDLGLTADEYVAFD
jgi:hypothetical protein